MKIKVLKFKLRYNGITYGPGAEVNMTNKEARKLVESEPEFFAYVPELAEVVELEQKVSQELKTSEVGVNFIPEDEHNVNLDKMNITQLKKFAKDNGIDVGNVTKKQELIDIIVAAAEPEEGLPAIDTDALVK